MKVDLFRTKSLGLKKVRLRRKLLGVRRSAIPFEVARMIVDLCAF